MSHLEKHPRVALFLPSYRGGGAERVILQLANAFASHGLGTDLLLGVDDGPYRDEKHPAVNAVTLGADRVSRCTRPLARWLRANRPEALISSMLYCNSVCAMANELAGHPTRHIVREALPYGREISGKPHLRLLSPWLLKRADAIVSMNHCMQDELNQHVPGLDSKRQHLIENPVDFKRLHEGLRAELPLPAHMPKRYLLAAGRLAPQKNYPLLIDAWAGLARERNMGLVILGEGELREALQRRIDDHELGDLAHLPGFDSNPYVWMNNAACFVLSSDFEGLPNVLVQAMLLGTPVVATRCRCGAADLIESAGTGRLVPTGDSQALRKAILETLDDPERVALPDAAWQNRFRLDTIVNAYAHLAGPEIAAAVANSFTKSIH